jgi:hypothetical protein
MSDEELLIVMNSRPVSSLVALSDEYIKRQEKQFKELRERLCQQ